MASQIETSATLESFFEEMLREAMSVESVQLGDGSFAYLARLFAEFADHDRLHGTQEAGERGTPGLVDLFQRAQSTEPSQRFEAFRHMGDVSLMVSGFFTPQVTRRRSLVDVNYYVDMGRAAYQNAAGLAARSGFSSLLEELASKFVALVEVLTRIAERTTLPVKRDLSALYERLLLNPQSASLQNRLIEQHAVPVFALAGVKA